MTCEGCDLNEASQKHEPTGQWLCESCIAQWDHDTGDDERWINRHQFCTSLRQAVQDYANSPGCKVIQEADGTWWNRYPSGQTVQIFGHCDHPEDVRCSVDAPSSNERASWLERLAVLRKEPELIST